MSEARVYVGTYGKYNSGSLKGKWVDLSDFSSKTEFYNYIKELHSDEVDPEFMFQDWEGIPSSLIDESWISDDLWTTYLNSDLTDEEKEDFQAFSNYYGEGATIEQFRDSYRGRWDSEEAFVEDWVDSIGLLDSIPEELRYYFDYEKYTQDLFINDYVSTEIPNDYRVAIFERNGVRMKTININFKKVKAFQDPNTMTFAEHAEAWYQEQGREVPPRNTPEWKKMYEDWHTYSFKGIGDKQATQEKPFSPPTRGIYRKPKASTRQADWLDRLQIGDRVRFTPYTKNPLPIEGIVQDFSISNIGNNGVVIRNEETGYTSRVWENEGDIEILHRYNSLSEQEGYVQASKRISDKKEYYVVKWNPVGGVWGVQWTTTDPYEIFKRDLDYKWGLVEITPETEGFKAFDDSFLVGYDEPEEEILDSSFRPLKVGDKVITEDTERTGEVKEILGPEEVQVLIYGKYKPYLVIYSPHELTIVDKTYFSGN